ncbi:hypothetical protein ACFL4H_00155 [Candidatus Neomarinimicrobiota bacterium]
MTEKKKFTTKFKMAKQILDMFQGIMSKHPIDNDQPIITHMLVDVLIAGSALKEVMEKLEGIQKTTANTFVFARPGKTLSIKGAKEQIDFIEKETQVAIKEVINSVSGPTIDENIQKVADMKGLSFDEAKNILEEQGLL